MSSDSLPEPRPGTVYLVGAGPGHRSLITVRGRDLLSRVDVILVDALVDPALLAGLPERVERRYVGKRAGRHVMEQEAIQELMIELAREGKSVVRLKGGDPLVFGRGGEEAIALKQAGIPYEIVPGITAATAATAWAGIPLTHRRKACYAVLYTANAAPARDGECGSIPLQDFARLHDGTLVAYMGVKVLPKLAAQLIAEGMPADQPCAVIERGATGSQRVVHARLDEIGEAVARANLRPPALIVIGHTVDLANRIGWVEPGPLAGKRVLVTRPAGQADELIEGLLARGAEVIPAPAIRFVEKQDRAEWDRVLDLHPANGWLVFTSENGVRYFFDGLRGMGRDLRWVGPLQIAAVGVATAAALSERGFHVDFVPEVSTGKALGVELARVIRGDEPAHPGDEDAERISPNQQGVGSEADTHNGGAAHTLGTVIRVRGELGNPAVETALQNAGIAVQPLTVYSTQDAELDEVHRAWVAAKAPDILVFTSGSTFQAFRRQWGEQAEEMLTSATIASIGPVTSSLIRGMGYEVGIEATEHNVPGLLAALA